jgi:hypothetical protein
MGGEHWLCSVFSFQFTNGAKVVSIPKQILT